MSESNVVSKKQVYVLVAVLIGIVLVLTAVSGVLYYQNKKNSSGGVNELESILSKLDKVIELPTESPTLATVNDKNKLPQEPFYKKAQNGDKVLLFNEARKAILYRPTTGKILEYITVSVVATPAPSPIGVGEQNLPDETKAQAPIKLALFNATNISGLTKVAEQDIKSKTKLNFTVVKRTDANDDYEKTLVVDLSGKLTTQATEIAKLFNGEVGDYPQSEASTTADIAVFVVK